MFQPRITDTTFNVLAKRMVQWDNTGLTEKTTSSSHAAVT